MVQPRPIQALAVAAALLVPSTAFAQSCVGSGAPSGGFALNGQVTFQDGETGWGLQSAADPIGPWGFGAGFGTIDQNNVGSNWIVSDAWVAREIDRGTFALCPRAGAVWSTWSDTSGGETTEIDEWSFPLGLSLGRPLAIHGQPTIPTLEAGIQWTRLNTEGPGVGEELERVTSGTDIYLVGGLTILFDRLYARGEVRLRSDSSSSLAFRSGFGIRF